MDARDSGLTPRWAAVALVSIWQLPSKRTPFSMNKEGVTMLPRTRPGESQAAGVIERAGAPGRRGLVALWNVWMAMRYRELIPAPTFELLVQPWVTVIGRLPEPA